MYNANNRFTPPPQQPALTGVGPAQYFGQPGVGPVWLTPAIARSLIVWDELPVIPPAPWYITERPVYIPGKGWLLTGNTGVSNPQPSRTP